MTPILREYLLKGLFLGLWAWLVIVQDPAATERPQFLRVLGWILGGLMLGLLSGAAVQIRRGYRPAENWKAFPLVVLIESSFWIYLGIVGGLTLGLVIEYDPPPDRDWLGYCAVAGAILGYGFFQLRSHRDRNVRFLVALLVGGLLIYLAIYYLAELPGFNTPLGRFNISTVILAGLPFFYLLTFCGEAEESEVEVAALCAGLGVGLYLFFEGKTSLFGDKFVLLAPLIIYFVYVTRWMPFLRVFKHTLRGYSALHLNRHLDALQSFKRALALSPQDELAAGGMWDLHQRIDVAKLPIDSPLLAHLDYEFCLDQAAGYLLGSRTPNEAERAKAEQMLDLVERQKPVLAPRVDYLRAISLTHSKRFDDAAAVLIRLLDPETPYATAARNGILFDAWDLALRLHPELSKRLGLTELAKPGRRMQAIAAVERKLAVESQNATALEMKALFYSGLTEAEFAGDAASGAPEEFNYDYAEQLGLALVDDPVHRERGMAFLRIAGRGLPERGPLIFSKLAELAEKGGQSDAARGYREQVKRAGVQIGAKSLPADQRTIYFSTLKRLAADAEVRGDFENAIGDYRLYLESGAGELEGFRKLADLYEKKHDPMNALLMAETGLVYSSTDKDLLTRKDRYYYSVDVERLQGVKDQVHRFFDVDYCVTKAKQVLDSQEPDAASLDWALHLAKLAKVIKPDLAAVRLMEARALLRLGQRDQALQTLEDLRELKPGGAGDDAWYTGTKILGDLYFNELNRPDLAVHCYLDYRDYSKSGADTLFNAAKCYEAMNDTKNAIRFYETVTAYEQHPKYWDAKSAIERLKG